ncbi:hypothetical protein [Rhizobium phage RHph_X2_30]|nr:hypothetical protein [Rhizobium phage RHph_X2_30]
MNIFQKVAAKFSADLTSDVMKIGKPLRDPDLIAARRTAFASMRRGAGFYRFADDRRETDASGHTRAERRQLRRENAFKAEAERRELERHLADNGIRLKHPSMVNLEAAKKRLDLKRQITDESVKVRKPRATKAAATVSA